MEMNISLSIDIYSIKNWYEIFSHIWSNASTFKTSSFRLRLSFYLSVYTLQSLLPDNDIIQCIARQMYFIICLIEYEIIPLSELLDLKEIVS